MHEGNAHLSCRKEREGLSTFSAFILYCILFYNYLQYYFNNIIISILFQYYFQAQRPDELDILSDEELEVLEWDDGDGWSKGKNKQGKEGYFPQSYVKSLSRPNSPTSNRGVSSLASDFLIMNTTSELKKSNGGLCPETVKENGK